MNALAESLVVALGRNTAVVAGGVVAVAWLLGGLKIRSARVHRAACCTVLLLGWCFYQIPIRVPWYEAATITSSDTGTVFNVEPAPLAEGESGAGMVPVLPDDSERRRAREAGAISTVAERSLMTNWAVVLAGLWLLGMAVGGAIPLWEYAHFAVRPPVSASPPEEWQRQWRALLRTKGIERGIVLRVTPHSPDDSVRFGT